MKRNFLRIVLILLLLETFFIIFRFSSQNAKQSAGLSSNVTKTIFKRLNQEEIENKGLILERMEKIMRKIAHFTIYTVVGVLLMSLVSTYNIKKSKRIICSLWIGVLYATSDEIHQLFVPGRSGQITDIILDSMGVLLGIVLVLTAIEINRKIKNVLIQTTRVE